MHRRQSTRGRGRVDRRKRSCVSAEHYRFKTGTGCHCCRISERLEKKNCCFAGGCHFAATAFTPADRGRHYRLKRVIQFLAFRILFLVRHSREPGHARAALREWETDGKKENGSDLFLVLRRG